VPDPIASAALIPFQPIDSITFFPAAGKISNPLTPFSDKYLTAMPRLQNF
jgi:hypothetical protein